MKVTVIVTIKASVQDPQGQTINNFLPSIGINNITGLRQGKIFHFQVSDEILPEERRKEVHRLAKEVLTNPVIEEYRITWR